RARLVHRKEIVGVRGRLRRHPGLVVDDTVERRAELLLEHGGLQTDHGAAEDLWLVVKLLDRVDHADGVVRIRADYHDIRVGRLERANDRAEVGRGRRIALVVNDLEAIFLRVVTRA